MPVAIENYGQGNRLAIDPDVLAEGSGIIVLAGDDVEVRIGPGCSLFNCTIRLGSECRLLVEPGCRLAMLEVFAASRGAIRIGSSTSFTAHTRLFLHEPGIISIGEGCLIGSDTLMTASDMHSLLDLDSGERINPAADITVGDGVWLAERVTLMKGVTIGSGSAVGYASVVTRDVPPHCLAAGYPARVLREHITWRPDLV